MFNQPSHIKDIDDYVFFSDRTKGSSGKPVKIHVNLFMDFLSAVDPSTHDGQTVIFQIENLKNSARPNSITIIPEPKNKPEPTHAKVLAKLRDINNTMSGRTECSLLTKNVRIYYNTYERTGDRCPTIYISDIQIISSKANMNGGLYDQVSSRSGNVVNKVNSVDLEGRKIFVSRGMSDSAKAMEEAKILTNTDRPALFFNPSSVADDIGNLSQPHLTDSSKKLVRELERTIKENQKKKVEWIVQGEGVSVLAHALKNIPGNLENHNFQFDNPRGNLPYLLRTLSQRHAILKGEFINHSVDQTSLLAIAGHRQELMAEISGLPAPKGYDNITRRYLVDRISKLGAGNKIIAQQQSLRSGSTTFIAAVNLANRIR